MKKKIKLVLIIGLSFNLFVQAQAEGIDSTKVKKSGITLGIKYLSNNVYLGRIDSANIMYLVPSIGYTHKSGIHFAASLAYQLDAGINKIDAIALEGGYEYKIGVNFSGGLSVEKYFFDMNSISLNSVNDFGVGTNFAYDFNFVSLNASAGLAFNEKTDVITEMGLSKSFEFDKFEIEPVIKFFAGTQNYYNSYLKAGKSHLSGNKGKGKGLGAMGKTALSINTVSGTNSTTYSVIKASNFKILDYELSVPITYSFHHLKFNIVPTFAFPVNAATILSSTGTIEKENLSNRFILQVGIDYVFN